MTYPGGKNGSGVYQKIINLMPKHKLYVEPFLGGGAIADKKKPAEMNWLNDIDRSVVDNFLINHDIAPFAAASEFVTFSSLNSAPAAFFNTTASGIFHILKSDWSRSDFYSPRETLIYADLPYIAAECTPGRPVYKYDMPFAYQHEDFLTQFIALPCMKMISHYKCALYDKMLAGWRQVTYNSPTRGGWKPDTVYLSFPEPLELHDYQYLGENAKKREHIRIKAANWEAKIRRMPPLERGMFFEMVDRIRSGNPENGEAIS